MLEKIQSKKSITKQQSTKNMQFIKEGEETKANKELEFFRKPCQTCKTFKFFFNFFFRKK